MSRRSRCSACALDVDAGIDRCPRCLRKSTVVGPDGPIARAPRLDLGGEAMGVDPPSFAGVRALALALAYLVCGPLVWLLLGHEAWFEAHALWLPACFAAMALGTLPLRMAFAAPDPGVDGARVGRHYASRMVAVLGIAAALFATQAIAAWLVAEPFVSIFLGLLFFLAPLLVVPALLSARREKRGLRAALAGGARGIALALGIVATVAVLSALRAASHPRPTPLVIPADVKGLLDPLDLESVRVESSWAPDEKGLATLHLRADGGDFERTRNKLLATAAGQIEAVGSAPKASGTVTLWLPERFDTAGNRQSLREQERMLAGALEARRTASGAPVRVVFAFGAPPGR